MNRFEDGLSKLAKGLAKPRCEKRLDKINERIGRLKERCHGSTLHIRKATIAEPTLQELYKKLRISSTPGGVKKLK